MALAGQAATSLELLSVHAPGGGWEQHLQSVADDLPVRDVDTTLVSTGPADEAIAELADRVPGTVVCMATRARTGLSGVLVGSVAARVVRRAGSPVMLIGPHGWAGELPSGFTELAVCLSGSERSARLVPVASAWARQLGVGMALVHGSAAGPDTQDAVESTMTRVHALAEEASSDHPPISAQVAPGSTPADGVRRYLEQHPGALALVSIRTGSRLEQLLPGGFTTELLQHAPTPVVTVTP